MAQFNDDNSDDTQLQFTLRIENNSSNVFLQRDLCNLCKNWQAVASLHGSSHHLHKQDVGIGAVLLTKQLYTSEKE